MGAPNQGNGAIYFYKLDNGAFAQHSKWLSDGVITEYGKSVSIGTDYAAIGTGNGKTVKIFKRNNTNWSPYATVTPFGENGQVEVAIDGNNLLISTNGDGGNAKIARYQLYGTNWTKTGEFVLGNSISNSVPLALNGTDCAAAYKSNDYNSSYGMINNFFNLKSAREESEAMVFAEPMAATSLISPNPLRSGNLYISMPEAQEVELTSLNGSYQRKFEVVGNKCDLSQTPKGMYLVKITTAEQVKMEKLVVE